MAVLLIPPIAWSIYLNGGGLYSWTGSFSDYMISILAAVIGIIGVSITGYIFMTESVRSLGDSDPYKKSVADAVRSRIYSQLCVILLFSIGEIILCVIFIDADEISNIEATVVSVMFSYILLFSIWLDLRMMNFNRGLVNSAKTRLDHLKVLFNTKPMVIRLDSEEYNNMIAKKRTGNMEDFTEDHDKSFQIKAYKGNSADKKDNEIATVPMNPLFQFHIHSVQQDRPSDPAYQIFYVIHGRDDNILYSQSSIWTRLKSLNLSTQYVLNRWSIIGYCDIHDEFDVYNVFHVFESIEKILCRSIGTESPVINKSDNMKLSSTLSKGTPYRAEAGMVDDIISLYYMVREYRDNYMVRFEEDYDIDEPSTIKFPDLPMLNLLSHECPGVINFRKHDGLSTEVERMESSDNASLSYMQAVSPFVYLLRYELSKKMSRLELSDLSLNGYDFSYGILDGSILKGSMLMNTVFYITSMNGIDLGKCDLTGSTFTRCSAIASYFGDAVLSNVLIEKTPLEESVFDHASITGSVFPKLNMKGCAFSNAAIVNSAFDDTRLTNTSFLGSKIISSRLNNCLMCDSKLISVSLSESMITNCDLSGSNIGKSSMSTSTIVNSRFIRTNLSESILTSDMILNCDFSSSLCQMIDFTGSQLLSVKFNSASLNKSNFTHAYIGPYELHPRSKWPVRDNELYDEYNNVQQKLKNIGNAQELKSKEMNREIKSAINLQTEVLSHISSFLNSLAQQCIFSDSELFQCRMYGTLLTGSSFTNTKLTDSCFQNSSFAETKFTDVLVLGCSFTNASFDGALIANTMFRNTIMHDASFAKCNLTQCRIADSDMDNTSFEGSTLINCTFYNVENLSNTIFHSTISNLVLDSCRIGDIRIKGTFDNVDMLKAEYDRLSKETKI